MNMEFNDKNEFESNQTNSPENNETNNINGDSIPANNLNESGQGFHGVDATISFDNQQSSTKEDTIETAKKMVNNDFLEKDNTRVTNKSEKKKNKGFLKGIATSVAAGLVGSVLTLTVLPHTNYMQNFYPTAQNQDTNSSSGQSSGPIKAVSAKATAGSNSSIADTVENVSKAIVGIDNFQNQQSTDFFGNTSSSQNVETGSGSGVIIQKNGDSAYIVTNNHVVEGANKLEVSLYDGSKTTAELVGTDALTDLAVLKIDSKYVTSVADFGDSSALRPGDPVYAIGNPLGSTLSRTVTQGIISATNRSIPVSTSAGSWETNVIQTDAAINPGNSGGALINPQGQVIGINSLKISESGVEGLGFAIPSNDVIPIVNQLIKNGKIDRPYLGVGLADLDQVPQAYSQSLPNNVNKGALVVSVDPNSGAGRGGFQPKDVIVSMNGTDIANSAELRKYLYTKVKTGDEVKFGVYRNGNPITLTAKLTSKNPNQ
ncbi:S1C family serine protease [Neobacillus massiliamazoniensis]|uniref:Serine protease HtrA n=1 Tax=Neobacillus massiliamazoniensis TaxID=1499688 RepID=A0A0U1P050_9BACI|nr:serine protease HtrA [Neobacillus massiliamazoniensis]